MIDDVLKSFIGKTEEENLRNFETIVSQLEEANLKVSVEKSTFMKTQVGILGYFINQNRILPEPKKIAAINKMKVPGDFLDWHLAIEGSENISRQLLNAWHN